MNMKMLSVHTSLAGHFQIWILFVLFSICILCLRVLTFNWTVVFAMFNYSSPICKCWLFLHVFIFKVTRPSDTVYENHYNCKLFTSSLEIKILLLLTLNTVFQLAFILGKSGSKSRLFTECRSSFGSRCFHWGPNIRKIPSFCLKDLSDKNVKKDVFYSLCFGLHLSRLTNHMV